MAVGQSPEAKDLLPLFFRSTACCDMATMGHWVCLEKQKEQHTGSVDANRKHLDDWRVEAESSSELSNSCRLCALSRSGLLLTEGRGYREIGTGERQSIIF